MSSARRAALATTLLATQLAVAAPAVAKNGEGLVGETNDKVITFFCLGLVLFFTLVVIVGTIVQGRLERRKDAKKAARMRQRVGW
jgi:nitrogen fixation/metabolism regulation signal transduction histidine kinase